ncbi:MAG: helix-turn-helix transcriptional regulator [Terracidiphilus sp.]|jgi:transcriptional regulator with XRE-family HTH domain
MISEALRLLRVYHNITQKQLADDLRISKSYVCEIESGKKKAGIDILESYAAHFKVPLSSLFFFSEELDQRKLTDRVQGKVAMAALRLLDTIAGREETSIGGEDLSN